MTLEKTLARTQMWHTHIFIIVAAEFAAESARGLVLPTLFAYAARLGGDLGFVAQLTALFSAGRFMSTLLFGWLSDRVSFKNLYLASAAFAIVGNALYVLPYAPQIHSKSLLAASRFLVGFGAGNRSVCRANLAALTRVDQRISYFTMLSTVLFLAYALTPGLGGVFSGRDAPVAGSELVHFNCFTAPGFILVVLNIATMLLVAVFYDDSVTRSDAPKLLDSTDEMRKDRSSSKPMAPAPRGACVMQSGIVVFIFLNFTARGMLSVFETINVPLYMKAVDATVRPRRAALGLVFEPSIRLVEYFESAQRRMLLDTAASTDAITGASQFFLMIGLLGLVSYAAVLRWGGQQRRITDVGFLGFAFSMLLLGNGVLVVLSKLFASGSRDTNEKFRLLVAAEILIWSIGSPIASAVIVPAFSKVLGTKPQGTLMGVFGASASIARIGMPLIASALPSMEVLFMGNIGLCAVSIATLVVYVIARRRHDSISAKVERPPADYMASTRLELRVAPIAGRKYPTIDGDDTAPFTDVFENELDPHSPLFAFHASFRGCCYNASTRTLLVCDPLACCVRTFDVEIRSDAEMCVVPRGHIGERGTGAGKFQCPVAVDVNSRGEVAVADYKLNRVAFFTGSGNALHYFGKTGPNRGEFRGVIDLKFTALGHVAVVDNENHRVQVMTTTGGLVLIIGRQGGLRGEFSFPCAVDIARNGDVFVCDSGNKRIQRFSAKGKWLAMWGSTRVRGGGNAPAGAPQYDVDGIPITVSPLRSVFEAPCDVLVGINSEVFVCDVARQEILVFNDAGSCLHVYAMPQRPRWSPIALCCVRNSLLVAVRSTPSPLALVGAASSSSPPLQEQPCDHKFVVVPPAEKIPTGKLTPWPWATLLELISYLTYADAVQIRLVNHVCHRACRLLRDQWRLFPLVPGRASLVKYGKAQHNATGRVAVVEAFNKWGLRIFKPANRIRRHVMDFDAGFRSAVSSLFGPMFFYQHEPLLRVVFEFYSTCADKVEIDEAAFIEIVTQIEEVRAGFLGWSQCPSLSQLPQLPAIRVATDRDPQQQPLPPRASVVSQLKLVENAQQHQLSRLLSRLQQL